jgi:hypothetical protein
MCEFGPTTESKYNAHINGIKHKTLELYIQKMIEEANKVTFEREQRQKESNNELIQKQNDSFQVRLDEAYLSSKQMVERANELSSQREQEFKQEIIRQDQQTLQREHELKQEIIRQNQVALQREREHQRQREIEKEAADKKFEECRLDWLHKNTEAQLHNIDVYKHCRDHGIDLTATNYTSKLSKIKPTFEISKSMCESSFHRKLMQTLLEPLNMYSVYSCTVCRDFKELSEKIYAQSNLEMMKINLSNNLTVGIKSKGEQDVFNTELTNLNVSKQC